MTEPSPGQAYRDPQSGLLMLYVRNEERNGVQGFLWVGARSRNVVTRWVSVYDYVPGELVNDTAGRVEACFERFERGVVEHERDELAETLTYAARWLSPSQMDELRAFYTSNLKASQIKRTETQ